MGGKNDPDCRTLRRYHHHGNNALESNNPFTMTLEGIARFEKETKEESRTDGVLPKMYRSCLEDVGS